MRTGQQQSRIYKGNFIISSGFFRKDMLESTGVNHVNELHLHMCACWFTLKTESLLLSLVTDVLFLLWQVKLSSGKKPYYNPSDSVHLQLLVFKHSILVRIGLLSFLNFKYYLTCQYKILYNINNLKQHKYYYSIISLNCSNTD